MSEYNPHQSEMNTGAQGGYPQPASNDFRPRSSQSHIWIGSFLLIIGVVYLLKRIGIRLPDFLFSWQMFLIGLGIFIGIRKKFEGARWMILILIGSIFLINEFFVFGELRGFILPIILIGSGLFFIFRPKNSKNCFHFDEVGKEPCTGAASGQDFVDSTSIFGGSKKKIFSKNFKGGDMTNIFGSSKIDLTQADINGTAVLEVSTLFGGATLLVPAHWNVVSEAVAIMGEVKDKRVVHNLADTSKTLLIKGTVMCGGIDIKSF